VSFSKIAQYEAVSLVHPNAGVRHIPITVVA